MEGIGSRLLPGTSTGQLPQRVPGTGPQSSCGSTHTAHPSAQRAAIARAVKQGDDNARGLPDLSPQMPPPPSYLQRSQLSLRNVTIAVENQNKKAT